MLPSNVLDFVQQLREQKKMVSMAQLFTAMQEMEQQEKERAEQEYNQMTDDQRRVHKMKQRLKAKKEKMNK